MWFEESTIAIKQARKFQFLIHKQENLWQKKQIAEKQDQINGQQDEVNDLKDQLKVLKKNIQDRKKVAANIKEQIKEQQIESKRILQGKQKEIRELKDETEINKKEFTDKFKKLDEKLDKVRYLNHKLSQEHQQIMWNNNMMYLFPVKVSEINDRIDRKKVEVELYRKIISETLGFMK